MPKLPENNWSFRNADGNAIRGAEGRMETHREFGDDLDGIYWALKPQTKGMEAGVENDMLDRALFLRTLEDLLEKEGTPLDVRQLFTDAAEHFVHPGGNRGYPNLYGSQVLLSLRAFDKDKPVRKKDNNLGPPETSTGYGFNFGAFPQNSDHGWGPNTALFELDARPMETLQRFGADPKLGEEYYRGFLKMAGMAEHDYIHQLVSLTRFYTRKDLTGEQALGIFREKKPIERHGVEMHALSLHAQVCDALFKQEKTVTGKDGTPKIIKVGERRKARVLAWAANQMKVLADMQDEAMQNARTLKQREEIRQAVTYLAEIYGHRLFRVISPIDDALKLPVLYDDKNHVVSSVAMECARLELQTPDKFRGPERPPGLETLQQLCELYLKDTYVQAHATRTTKINRYAPTVLPGIRIPLGIAKEVPLTTVIAEFAKDGLPEMKETRRKLEEYRAQKAGKLSNDAPASGRS